jgi:hypothetical protein
MRGNDTPATRCGAVRVLKISGWVRAPRMRGEGGSEGLVRTRCVCGVCVGIGKRHHPHCRGDKVGATLRPPGPRTPVHRESADDVRRGPLASCHDTRVAAALAGAGGALMRTKAVACGASCLLEQSRTARVPAARHGIPQSAPVGVGLRYAYLAPAHRTLALSGGAPA